LRRLDSVTQIVDVCFIGSSASWFSDSSSRGISEPSHWATRSGLRMRRPSSSE
jgi:hypothetical protein